jgi:acyl-CoA thioesterase FadM
VYTPRFADYVVEAHLAFFEQMFGAPTYERLGPLGLALPAKAISIVFKHSLKPDQLFDMSAWVADVRTRTYDMDVNGATTEGTEAFVGRISLICLNQAEGKSHPLPPFLRVALTRLRERHLFSP